MERLTLPDHPSPNETMFYNNLMDMVLGNPIILESAPTTADEKLKENTLGFDGTNLFITLLGVTYKISLTAV